MSINLVQAVNTAMTESIAEQLAQQFGIPGNIVRQLASRTAPGLVAALMDRASLAQGARQLHSVIMLPETNAYIVDQLDKLISTTGGLKHLESSGHALAAEATGKRMDLLTDAVSVETGVPTQATSALAGVAAAVLFGVIKRYFLLAQWGLPQLPPLLREQVPEMRTSLSNGVATAIGIGNADGFTNSIGTRLDAVASTLAEREEVDALATAAVGESVARSTPVHASSVAPAAPAARSPAAAAPTRAPVRSSASPKKSNKWIWLLFAVLAGILALVYYHGFTNSNSVDLNQTATTSPTASVEKQASSVDAPLVASIATEASAPVAQAASATPATAASASAAVSASAVASAPDAATVANANADARLVFSVSPAGVPSVTATVGTEAEKQSLIDALTARFGKGYTADVTVTPNTRPATWLAQLKNFLPLMAVPGAEVKVSGSKVELSGAAADTKLGWTDRLKSALGGMFTVGSFDVNGAIASATQSFRDGIKTLLAAADACSGTKLTKVLDLQVVNFARSSATVPESAYATLGETVQLLKNCAAKGSMVNLDVAGYSDSQGPARAKLEMSKERAQAVRGYLVRAGVPTQTLTATGYGDANPLADNSTESGRFKNRRIEFVVK
ncbi:OmpA domain protein [Candidatus Burkholderia verschuerenii]|uniref:OmpA domain protein n=1 Tax=Candidatus Burkholderia verschuerenii TaxID=242163 RepID=A0A0L0MEP0_9BURK|nr:OmpA family protein [Candidatus Burkholderia verschuerenii]KND60740.1 OmpA domain protein [Candidatus Burkholderia verschuerenii]